MVKSVLKKHKPSSDPHIQPELPFVYKYSASGITPSMVYEAIPSSSICESNNKEIFQQHLTSGSSISAIIGHTIDPPEKMLVSVKSECLKSDAITIAQALRDTTDIDPWEQPETITTVQSLHDTTETDPGKPDDVTVTCTCDTTETNSWEPCTITAPCDTNVSDPCQQPDTLAATTRALPDTTDTDSQEQPHTITSAQALPDTTDTDSGEQPHTITTAQALPDTTDTDSREQPHTITTAQALPDTTDSDSGEQPHTITTAQPQPDSTDTDSQEQPHTITAAQALPDHDTTDTDSGEQPHTITTAQALPDTTDTDSREQPHTITTAQALPDTTDSDSGEQPHTITTAQPQPDSTDTDSQEQPHTITAAQALPDHDTTDTDSREQPHTITTAQALPDTTDTDSGEQPHTITAAQALPDHDTTDNDSGEQPDTITASQALPDHDTTDTDSWEQPHTITTAQALPDHDTTDTDSWEQPHTITTAQALPDHDTTDTDSREQPHTITTAQALPDHDTTDTDSGEQPDTITTAQALPDTTDTDSREQPDMITAAQALPDTTDTDYREQPDMITAAQAMPDTTDTDSREQPDMITAAQALHVAIETNAQALCDTTVSDRADPDRITGIQCPSDTTGAKEIIASESHKPYSASTSSKSIDSSIGSSHMLRPEKISKSNGGGTGGGREGRYHVSITLSNVCSFLLLLLYLLFLFSVCSTNLTSASSVTGHYSANTMILGPLTTTSCQCYVHDKGYMLECIFLSRCVLLIELEQYHHLQVSAYKQVLSSPPLLHFVNIGRKTAKKKATPLSQGQYPDQVAQHVKFKKHCAYFTFDVETQPSGQGPPDNFMWYHSLPCTVFALSSRMDDCIGLCYPVFRYEALPPLSTAKSLAICCWHVPRAVTRNIFPITVVNYKHLKHFSFHSPAFYFGHIILIGFFVFTRLIILAFESRVLCRKKHSELQVVSTESGHGLPLHESPACLTRCGKRDEAGPWKPAELALLSARTNEVTADNPELHNSGCGDVDNSATVSPIAPTVQTFNGNVEDPDQNVIVIDSTSEDTDQEDDATEADEFYENPEVKPTDLSLHPFHAQLGAAAG